MSVESQRKLFGLRLQKRYLEKRAGSDAVQPNEEKKCGVCSELVMNKRNVNDRFFGVLPNCSHCFCKPCIKKCEFAAQGARRTAKRCPECKTVSDFLFYTKTWVEDGEIKQLLIKNHKAFLKTMPCYDYDAGRGCRHNDNDCLFHHKKKPGPAASRVSVDDEQRSHSDLFADGGNVKKESNPEAFRVYKLFPDTPKEKEMDFHVEMMRVLLAGTL